MEELQPPTSTGHCPFRYGPAIASSELVLHNGDEWGLIPALVRSTENDNKVHVKPCIDLKLTKSG